MRRKLNLKALRVSHKRKWRKIAEKAYRMMDEKWETPYLSEDEIMQLASRFPYLKVSVVIGCIVVKSKIADSWMIVDEGDFYALYHKNIYFDKGKMKETYHIQDVFYDLEFLFASISSHDDCKMGVKKRNIRELKELAEQGR